MERPRYAIRSTALGAATPRPRAARSGESGRVPHAAATAQWLGLPGVRMAHVWTVLAVSAPFVLASGVPFTPDTWWALTMGRLELQAGGPVDTVLAHAPAVSDHPNGQWLGQALLYLAYAAGGAPGARLLAGLVLSAAYGLTLARARLGGAGLRGSAVAVLLAVLLGAGNFGIRSQLFSYVLFAATYLILGLHRSRPGLVWLLPPLFALWSQLHGAFVIGLALIVLHAGGEAIDAAVERARGGTAALRPPVRLAVGLLAALAASSLNPLGARVYAFVADLAAHPALGLAEEWQPTTLRSPAGLALAASLIVLILVLRAGRRRVTASEGLLLLAFGLLAASAQRHVVWWGFVLAPIVARHADVDLLPARLRRLLPERPPGGAVRRLSHLGLAGLIACLALSSPAWRPQLVEYVAGPEVSAAYAPAGAAEFLAGLPSGRLFNPHPWAGYLAWRLWPAQQPFLDTRVEAHPAAVWADFLAVDNGTVGWQAILDRYGVDYLLLDARGGNLLLGAAEASGRWVRAYEDSTAVVLIKRVSSATPVRGS